MPRLFASEILRAPQDSPGNPTGPTLPGGFISQNQSAISTHAGERAAGIFRAFTTALRARLELTITQAHEGGIERAHIGDSQTHSTTSSQTNTTSTPGEPSFTETLRSTLANPPQNHNFEPSHETRPRILEIARAHGLEIVSPVGSGEISHLLGAGTRQIRENLGVDTIFYRGGPGGQLAFTPRGNPDLIFVNVDPSRSDIPLSWCFSHELLHVSQKDAASGGMELGGRIEALLSRGELAALHADLEYYGYPESEFATELPAFLVGDAISGKSVFGLGQLERADEIRQLIQDHFDGLTKLTPTSLPASPDSEMADAGTESAKLVAKRRPSAPRKPLSGVDFTGHPDLYPVGPGQKNIVKIQLSGGRRADYKLANIAASIGKTQKGPKGYTWHHLYDYDPVTNTATMQLVKTKTHEASFPHKGSVAQYEQAKGIEYKK